MPQGRPLGQPALRLFARVLLLWCGLLGGVPQVVAALPTAGPVPLPPQALLATVPALRTNDLVLVESRANGTLKQLSLATLIAAPPELVHRVIWDIGQYPQFVNNLTKSSVTPDPDGSVEHAFELSYTAFRLDGHHRYFARPSAPGMAMPPVEIIDSEPWPPGQGPRRYYRCELFPAGGGTLLAIYGVVHLEQSGNLVRKLLAKSPSLEHGIALTSLAAFGLRMKARAEALAGAQAVTLPIGGTATYDALLGRGIVALLRTGALAPREQSLIARTTASPEALARTIGAVGDWQNLVPVVTRSTQTSAVDGQGDKRPEVTLELSLPLLSFTSRFVVRTHGYSVDLLAIGGELRGMRLRWDVQPGSPSHLILRSQKSLAQASLALRQLFAVEPLFEQGISLGLDLVFLNSLRARAEADAAAPASGSP